MKTIRVQKSKLLEILRKNRAEHREIFLKAQQKFREVAIQELDKQLQAAREGQRFVLRRITQLIEPQDYTAKYDRAIQMLEMSVDDTIEITNQEFQNFIQDIWNWSRSWALSNSGYVSSPKLAALSGETDEDEEENV